jgi:hypothetical protein
MSTKQISPPETEKATTSNLITAEELAGALKMAGEGIKKKPGLMKSTVSSMELPGGESH